MANLKGTKVAILVTDCFEQDELVLPRKALDEAGARTKVVSPKPDTVKGWKHVDWGDSVTVTCNWPKRKLVSSTLSCCPVG